MGAPKKKWSEEEEGALNAGIERYGAGKWSAILNDPDYQSVLSSRTNVDLKDKWRNIRAMKEGVGHRQRGFGALRIKGPPKSQNKNLPATSGAIVQYVAKTAKAPKLKHSVPSTSGLALAVKPPEDLKKDVQMQMDPQSSDMEIVQVDSPKAGKHGTTTAGVKYEVDDELQQQKMLEEAVEVVKHGRTKAAVKLEIDYKELVNMTEEEANIAAAEAVAEAEAAIERAARAMREAEAAEEEALAARSFAEAAHRAYERVW